ncbi:MAG: phosphoglycerate dehydrogenase [Deltaproteobacteria bacterium]|nr:phosphoglycerate dehydrogenase [Deltaproteobacteria bacterium]
MKEKTKILIAPSTFAVIDSAPLELLQRAGLDIIVNPYGRKLNRRELTALLPGVVGVLAGLESLDKDVLEKSQLRAISRCGAGLDNVDLVTAKNLGIMVFNTPDAPTEAVAELAVAMMILLCRQVPEMSRALSEGAWKKMTGFQLRDKAVVIVGYGRIGQAVAQLLRPFRPRLIIVDPFADTSIQDGCESLSLQDALHQADVITLHASGDRELLGREAFSLMKPGVILLNASRGALIDENELLNALINGTVSGAWLDTFSREPYDGPLKSFPQVILTPHIGSYAAQCRSLMEMQAAENLLFALADLKTRE